jgi:hypothetical protein
MLDVMKFACKITDKNGFFHFTGVNSVFQEKAEKAGLTTTTIIFDADCEYPYIAKYVETGGKIYEQNWAKGGRYDKIPCEKIAGQKLSDDFFRSL